MKTLRKIGVTFAIVAGMLGSGLLRTARQEAPARGSVVQDGTVSAGKSPGTNRAMYTTREDAPGEYTWDGAMQYCAVLRASGHKDWRVPTREELEVLFNNRAAIAEFGANGSPPVGWYWSSSQTSNRLLAWAEHFSDGDKGYDDKEFFSSLRCVRG